LLANYPARGLLSYRPPFDKGENFIVSHRLRDTFAVECLLAGVPLERVSILLGHSTVKVTERHYAPWIQKRQQQLEADLRAMWSNDEQGGLASKVFSARCRRCHNEGVFTLADIQGFPDESLDRRLASGITLKHEDIEAAAIEGAVQRLRPKLMTVTAVLASLLPILWESGIGSDVMKPIAAPIVGGMITSTIHVLILVPVFFVVMKERALRAGTLGIKTSA
jgi:hypothetical protein